MHTQPALSIRSLTSSHGQTSTQEPLSPWLWVGVVLVKVGLSGSGSRLSGPGLSGSWLLGSRLSGSGLLALGLSQLGLWLLGSRLSGSKLSGSKLSGSELSGSKLSGSGLSGLVLAADPLHMYHVTLPCLQVSAKVWLNSSFSDFHEQRQD